MARKAKIDWLKIETDYITGSLSYSQLADKYKVSRPYLARKASIQKWVSKRNRHRENVKQGVVEKVEAEAILNRSEFDLKAQQACDIAVAKALRVLAADDGDRNEVAKALHLLIPELDKITFTKSPIEVALAIVEKAVNVKYRILDIPTPTATKITGEIHEIHEVGESMKDAIKEVWSDPKARRKVVKKLKKKHASDRNKK